MWRLVRGKCVALLVGMWPLWYVALYGGHLARPDHCVASQIVQFTFPLWRSGTAVFLASGSRCVTPRPFIGRDPAATHCAHTRLYYLYQKMWAARVSFIHCSACMAVFWLLSSLARRSVCLGASSWSGVWSGRVGSPLWSARTAVRYTHLSARLCALDRIYKRIALERSTQLWDRLWPGPKTMCTQRGSQAENYPITRQQIDDILQYLEREYLGERQRTAPFTI